MLHLLDSDNGRIVNYFFFINEPTMSLRGTYFPQLIMYKMCREKNNSILKQTSCKQQYYFVSLLYGTISLRVWIFVRTGNYFGRSSDGNSFGMGFL